MALYSKQAGKYLVEVTSAVGDEWYDVLVHNPYGGPDREFEVRAGDFLMRKGHVKVSGLCCTFPEFNDLPICYMDFARQAVREFRAIDLGPEVDA